MPPRWMARGTCPSGGTRPSDGGTCPSAAGTRPSAGACGFAPSAPGSECSSAPCSSSLIDVSLAPPAGRVASCSPLSALPGADAAFPDAGGLAAQPAEVVQLGPADPALGDHLDLVDGRAVHGEGALHAYA